MKIFANGKTRFYSFMEFCDIAKKNQGVNIIENVVRVSLE